MNELISDLLISKKLLLRKFKTLDISKLTKNRSYEVYFGVDTNNNFNLIYLRNAKSRFIKKDALKLIELDKLIQQNEDKIVKKKVLFYKSEICSKSLEILKKDNWKLYDFM